MTDIFISYKSERRPAARQLAKALRCYGYSVWYDYNLVPGEQYIDALNQKLEECKVVVVLWCSLSIKSQWVRQEAKFAVEAGKYVPCWIEAAALDLEFETKHTIDLVNWNVLPKAGALDPLIAEIGRRTGKPPTLDFDTARELEEDLTGIGKLRLAALVLSDPPEWRNEGPIPPDPTRSVSLPAGTQEMRERIQALLKKSEADIAAMVRRQLAKRNLQTIEDAMQKYFKDLKKDLERHGGISEEDEAPASTSASKNKDAP